MRDVFMVGIKRLAGICVVILLLSLFLYGALNGARWVFYDPNCHQFWSSAIANCISEPDFWGKCSAVFSILFFIIFIIFLLGVSARDSK